MKGAECERPDVGRVHPEHAGEKTDRQEHDREKEGHGHQSTDENCHRHGYTQAGKQVPQRAGKRGHQRAGNRQHGVSGDEKEEGDH